MKHTMKKPCTFFFHRQWTGTKKRLGKRYWHFHTLSLSKCCLRPLYDENMAMSACRYGIKGTYPRSTYQNDFRV